MRRWLLAAAITGSLAAAAFAYVTRAIFDADPVVLGPDSGNPFPVVIADATGDGIPDVVTAATESTAVHVHPGRGDGTFGQPFTLTGGPEESSDTLLAGRLNGDAYDDFVLNHVLSQSMDVLLSDGAGGYARTGLPTSYEYPALADWDGDGDLDIVCAGSDLRLRRNDGAGVFAAPETLLAKFSGLIAPIVVADLDGDGRLDVLQSQGPLRAFWQEPDGSILPSAEFPYSHCFFPAVADFDHDGLLDIAATRSGGRDTGGVDVFLHTGARTFAEPVYVEDSLDLQLSQFAAADVNHDGSIDLVTSNHIYLNDGTGGLLRWDDIGDPAYWDGLDSVGVATADFDGDQRPEIVMTDGSGGTFVYSTHADEAPVIPMAIESMTPSAIGPGATQVTFTGVSFPDSVTVDLGRGIAVSDVVRESSTSVRLTATVPATARPVTRIAVVRGGSGSAATIPFQVVNASAPPVVVTKLTPRALHMGESAPVIVDGSGFAGEVVAELLPGVQVATTTVDSATRLTLDVTAPATAVVGPRTLVLTDDWGDTVVEDAFDVRPERTLDLVQKTGRAQLRKHAARDAFSVTGTLAFNALSADGTFDPSAEPVEIRYGDPAAPQVVTIPALKGWTVRKDRATWKSGKRGEPRVTFSVDRKGGAFRLDVTRADLVLPGPEVQIAFALGGDEGTDVRPWEGVRDGLRLR